MPIRQGFLLFLKIQSSNEIMEKKLNFNSNYSLYYDLLYEDKDYQSESNYVLDLINRFTPKASNLIELGSGTGNHANYLCMAGLSVTGLERSEEMVKISNKKNISNFYPLVADIKDFDLTQKFDVAISLFHVICYLNNNNDLISCFNNVCKHLNAGGIFIFDVWYSPAVYVQKPETRIRRISNDTFEIIRLAESKLDSARNVVDVNFEIIITNKQSKIQESYQENHPMRHFSIPEIELLAKQTGFSLVATEEFLSGSEPGVNTWGVCFILKKI